MTKKHEKKTPATGDKPVFTDPIDLSKKVRYTESGIDSKKLERADETSKRQYKRDYLSEIDSDLDALKTLRQRMSEEIENRNALKKELFQLVHKIRGQAGTFDYQLVSVLGDRLCAFLERNNHIGEQELSVINVYVDSLHTVITQKIEGDGGEMGKEILRGIDAAEIIEGVSEEE